MRLTIPHGTNTGFDFLVLNSSNLFNTNNFELSLFQPHFINVKLKRFSNVRKKS